MRPARTAVFVLLAPLLGSCATLRDVMAVTGVRGPDAGDLVRAGLEAEQSSRQLRERCAQLEKEEIPLKEEIALGGAVAVNWMQTGGGLFHEAFGEALSPEERAKPRNGLNLFLGTVGKNLALQSDRPLLEWSFGVLDSPSFNAFSAPGGYVMVTRGLLREVKSEAELAGVLAHEIGHITQRHSLTAYREVRVAECNKAAAATATQAALGSIAGSILGSIGATGLDLDNLANLPLLTALTDGLVDALRDHGFDEKQELEADRIAVELLVRAGYSPEPYITFLGKVPRGGDANQLHHPPSEDRQQQLRAHLFQLSQDPLLATDVAPVIAPLTTQLAAVR